MFHVIGVKHLEHVFGIKHLVHVLGVDQPVVLHRRVIRSVFNDCLNYVKIVEQQYGWRNVSAVSQQLARCNVFREDASAPARAS